MMMSFRTTFLMKKMKKNKNLNLMSLKKILVRRQKKLKILVSRLKSTKTISGPYRQPVFVLALQMRTPMSFLKMRNMVFLVTKKVSILFLTLAQLWSTFRAYSLTVLLKSLKRRQKLDLRLTKVDSIHDACLIFHPCFSLSMVITLKLLPKSMSSMSLESKTVAFA